MKYKDIANELVIDKSTVTSHMTHVYVAFEIDHIKSPERRKVLFQQICYYVDEITQEDEPADEIDDSEPEPVSERIKQIVEQDEKALVLWKPEPLTVVEKPKPKDSKFARWVTCGIIFGILLTVGIGYTLWRSGIIQLQGLPEISLPGEGTGDTTAEGDGEEGQPQPANPTQTQIQAATQVALLPSATQKPLPAAPQIIILLPFTDSFDLRMRPEWDPVIGTWRVVDGHLTTDPPDDWVRVLTGDIGWMNYVVDVDVWADDWLYPVQIIVRSQEGGYLVLQTNIHNTDFILFTNGSSATIAHSDTGIDDHLEGGRYERVYHLRVEANGDIFTVYIDGNRILQVQDSTLGWGQVGLAFRTPYDPTWFDNFKVSPLP